MLHAGWLLALCLHAQVPPEVEKAKATLATKPDDPQANLVVGKYHLLQGEADEAVPCLLKGPDTPLRAAAKAEEGTADVKGAKLVTVGDGWLKAGTGPLRQACMDRASWWYGKAWPDLDAAQKPKLLQRLKALYAGPPRAPRLGTGPGWSGASQRVSDCVHSGTLSFFVNLSAPGLPAGNGSIVPLSSTLYPVAPDTPCVFTCWVLTDGTDSDKDDIQVWEASRDFKRAPVPHGCMLPRDLPVWTKLSLSFTSGDDRQLQVNVGIHSRKGRVYLDDISLKANGKELLRNGGFEE